MREPAPRQSDTPDASNAYDPRNLQRAQQWPTPPMLAHGAGGPVTPESATVTRRPPRRRSFVGDVSAGLFLGDFATDLGLPGAVTQVVVSFVPLIGSTCAVRDLIADLRHHDHLGAALNALALTPVLGGFSKTFEVIRSTAHVGHAMHVSQQQAERKREQRPSSRQPARRRR
ncbi:MAG TPA: hypothetical protein VE338_06640 [Ktedonobacterales bacterium]|nr:hypothetical protein [Ktedonobacterales bacterium]